MESVIDKQTGEKVFIAFCYDPANPLSSPCYDCDNKKQEKVF